MEKFLQFTYVLLGNYDLGTVKLKMNREGVTGYRHYDRTILVDYEYMKDELISYFVVSHECRHALQFKKIPYLQYWEILFSLVSYVMAWVFVLSLLLKIDHSQEVRIIGFALLVLPTFLTLTMEIDAHKFAFYYSKNKGYIVAREDYKKVLFFMVKAFSSYVINALFRILFFGILVFFF